MPSACIDQDALDRLERIGGARLVREMIDLFLEHVPLRLEEAQAGMESGNLRAAQNALHSILSSAGNIGALELERLAMAGEQLADSNAREQMGPLVTQMQQIYREIDACLQRKRLEYQT